MLCFFLISPLCKLSPVCLKNMQLYVKLLLLSNCTLQRYKSCQWFHYLTYSTSSGYEILVRWKVLQKILTVWLFFEQYISKQKQTRFYQLRQSTVPEFDHFIKKQINENRFISTYLHYWSSILNGYLKLAAHTTELSCQTFARVHSFEQITLVLASWHQLWVHFWEKVEILFTGVSNQWDFAATEIEKDKYSEGDDGSQANVAVFF